MNDEELAAWSSLEGKRFKAWARGDRARAEELEKLARGVELRAMQREAGQRERDLDADDVDAGGA